jgi:hypothetical protein
MQLKDLEIKNLKPPEKPKKLSDGGGLCLYLAPNGLKSFRFDYRFQGKRRALTIVTYPEISLKEAREKLIDSKRTLREGVDPGLQKKVRTLPEATENPDTFEALAREWFERKKVGKKENYTRSLSDYF